MANMTPRQSNNVIVNHFQYDQTDVDFEQQFYSYEYKEFRGEITPRIINTVNMRGR